MDSGHAVTALADLMPWVQAWVVRLVPYVAANPVLNLHDFEQSRRL